MATIEGVLATPGMGSGEEVATAPIAEPRARSRDQADTLGQRWWYRLLLGATILLSASLEFFRIGQEGSGNSYYAAAVKSMLDNWHAFFFVSFDSSGFVSVDKPPLGLWLQTLSAKLFGFHGWSVLLPQMLATVGSVLVLWFIVRRAFGPVAALIAALALAVCPISVATGRNNTSDSVLTLLVLFAAWVMLIATERASFRWVALSMTLIGLGFNIKMLEAYLVLPAIGLVYLLAPGISLKRKIGHLTAGGVVLAVVSFSWATIVELTPADKRPFVGSSTGNSVFNLIFGYNGIERLIPGNGWTIFGFHIGSGESSGSGAFLSSMGSIGGAGENGAVGVFRLLNAQLGGQIGWLLPFAVIGFLAAWGPIRSLAMNPQRLQLVLWGIWSTTQVVFFSVANHFHRYYLTILGPAIAALAGIGAVALWRWYRRGGWRSLMLPAAIAITAASQLRILDNFDKWSARIGPAIVLLALFSVLGLLVGLMAQVYRGRQLPRFGLIVATAGMVALLIAPATWSGITAADGTNSTLPAAGPEASQSDGAFAGGGPGTGGARVTSNAGDTGETADQGLIDYLLANRGDAEWIVAVQSAQQGSSLILEIGEAVMALGGFKGDDQILTADAFAQLVKEGKVRYVLTGNSAGGRGGGPTGGGQFTPPTGSSSGSSNGQGSGARPTFGNGEGGAPSQSTSNGSSSNVDPPSGGGSQLPAQGSGGMGGAGGSSDVTQWVTANCTAVPSSDYASTSSSSSTQSQGFPGGGGASGLYDCQGAAE